MNLGQHRRVTLSRGELGARDRLPDQVGPAPVVCRHEGKVDHGAPDPSEVHARKGLGQVLLNAERGKENRFDQGLGDTANGDKRSQTPDHERVDLGKNGLCDVVDDQLVVALEHEAGQSGPRSKFVITEQANQVGSTKLRQLLPVEAEIGSAEQNCVSTRDQPGQPELRQTSPREHKMAPLGKPLDQLGQEDRTLVPAALGVVDAQRDVGVGPRHYRERLRNGICTVLGRLERYVRLPHCGTLRGKEVEDVAGQSRIRGIARTAPIEKIAVAWIEWTLRKGLLEQHGSSKSGK